MGEKWKKKKGVWIDDNDFADIMYRAVVRCDKSHDESRQKYTTSLYRFLNWEYMRYLQGKERQISEDFDIYAPEQPEDNSDELEYVKTLVKFLPKEHREILVKHFFDGCTLEEISDSLKLPLTSVKNSVKESIEKLKSIHSMRTKGVD